MTTLFDSMKAIDQDGGDSSSPGKVDDLVIWRVILRPAIGIALCVLMTVVPAEQL